MQRLDGESLKFWEDSSKKYHQDLDEKALSYLTGRGLSTEAVASYRLGYVADPLPGHEAYQGRIAIPILKKLCVVGFQFRCIEDHSCKDAKCAKYLTDGGQWLYNTAALDIPGDVLGICEGGFDSYVLTSGCGIPTIGIPGVEAWKGHPWWPDLTKGHKKVLIFADNDTSNEKNPGMRLAKEILRDVPRARLVTLPPDSDPTDTYLKYGREEIYKRSGYTPPTQRHLELVS
jgi:hypothetical protein